MINNDEGKKWGSGLGTPLRNDIFARTPDFKGEKKWREVMNR